MTHDMMLYWRRTKITATPPMSASEVLRLMATGSFWLAALQDLVHYRPTASRYRML
jgi:hypothetical protein